MAIVLQNDACHYLTNASNADIKALNRLLVVAEAKAKKINPFKCILLEICFNMSGAG